MVLISDCIHERLGISGSVAEIGIFLGDYLCMLASCAAPHEKSVAIDLFLNQHLNVDESGKHDKSIEWHIENYKSRVFSGATAEWIAADSLFIEPSKLLKVGCGQYRLISIDGGHEPYHVTQDIRISAACLTHGGIVIVDDYTNHGWPGVAEGVARHFLLSSHQTLAPFFVGSNKLLLTSISFHREIFCKLEEIFTVNALPFKVKKLYGFPLIVQEGPMFPLVESSF